MCIFVCSVGAQACAIVFSTVDRDSFDAVEKWRAKVLYVIGCVARTACLLFSQWIMTLKSFLTLLIHAV